MTSRAAIYCRVSSEDQAAPDKDSLGNQERLCRKYCEAMEYGVADGAVYVDTWTGKEKERPEFERLLADVTRGGIDVVVCHQVDRLGRDTADLVVFLKEKLRPNACEIAVVAAGINTATPEGRLMFQLMAAFAEFDRCKIVERTTRGKKYSADQGLRVDNHGKEKGNAWGGQEPYGYTWRGGNSGILDIKEDEAAVVREVFRLEREPPIVIAQHLNRGPWARTKTGKDWKAMYVSEMLKRRDFYMGRGCPVRGSSATLTAPAIITDGNA